MATTRTARIARKTHETDIAVEVNLDGTGTYQVSTGIGFLDHMIEQFSRHSLIDITCHIQGDLHVDQHHTAEDSAIAIGQAIARDTIQQQAQFVGAVRAIADQPLHAVLRDVLCILRPDAPCAQERAQWRAFLAYERDEGVRRCGWLRRVVDQGGRNGQGWPRLTLAGAPSSFTRR